MPLRGGEQHEREFAAAREPDGDALRVLVVASSDARDREHQRRLQRHETDRDAQHDERLRREQREVRAHPDGHEEEPHQQALERLDVGFELVAEFRIGEEHAGEERAERHRQADGLHQQRRPRDDEERRCGEHLAAAETRDQPQGGADQQTAADDDDEDRRHALDREQPATGGAAAVGSEQRQERDQRNHRDILEEQDRERALPGGSGELGALAEPCEDDCRRRHREAGSNDCCGRPREPERVRDEGHDDAGDDHLCAAQSEHRMAQRPKSRGLELEADEEQQQHDAELGKAQRCLCVWHHAEAPRTDERPCREIAQHGSQLQPAEQRHDEHRGGEEDGGLFEERHGVPPRSLSGLVSRTRRRRFGRRSRRETGSISGICRGRATQKCAQSAPSLRVAAEKRVCFVARLAKIHDIRCTSRRASIAFWPGNAYVKSGPTGSYRMAVPRGVRIIAASRGDLA